MSNHVLVLWVAHEYNTYSSCNGRTDGPDWIEVVSEALVTSEAVIRIIDDFWKENEEELEFRVLSRSFLT